MRKLRIALLMIFIICIINTVNVFATDATAEISVDKSTVKPGDTIIVKLNATCNEGLSAVVTGIQYDKEVLTLQSSTVPDKWVNYGVDKYEILSNSTEKITSLNVLTLTFKLNQNVEEDTTKISTTAIEITDINNKEYNLGKSEKTITIENVKDKPTEDKTTQDEEEKLPSSNTNNQVADNSTGSGSVNNKVDNTITNTKIPNTGYRSIFITVASIIIVVAIFIYIQIKRYSLK